MTEKSIALRLQGASNGNHSGRLEVFYQGQWGTICDDLWGLPDATVACRQLGYVYAVKALQGRDVTRGTGQIWLDDVSCSGNERSLADCPHRGWGSHNCGHSEDAGVECSSTGKTSLNSENLSVMMLCKHFKEPEAVIKLYRARMVTT